MPAAEAAGFRTSRARRKLETMRLPSALALALVGVAAAQDQNVLLVVIDDVGVDRVGAYGAHPHPGRTPTLDGLAERGVRFERCWANSLCSPTRATILTGRYGFRTGIGNVITSALGMDGLLLEEWTLPEVLRLATAGTYRALALGKWHLGSPDQGLWHAVDSGFELWAGSPENLGDPGDENAYYHWLKAVAGKLTTVDRYATTDTVNDTLRAVQALGERPWFLYVALNAAHVPFHAPPPELHDFPLSGDPDDTPVEHHKAAVQALDSELGRLLQGIDPSVLARTTVIVVGDNGTQPPATEPPFIPEHGKGTLFEGGIRVPLIVAGAGVAPQARGRACAALVNTTDLFRTVLELCGVQARDVIPPDVPLDSLSLRPYLADPGLDSRRRFAYAEAFKPNHPAGSYTKLKRAMRGERYKLARNVLDGTDRLYDLRVDPRETRNLLLKDELSGEERRAYLDLRRALDALVGD